LPNSRNYRLQQGSLSGDGTVFTGPFTLSPNPVLDVFGITAFEAGLDQRNGVNSRNLQIGGILVKLGHALLYFSEICASGPNVNLLILAEEARG
jgi:hypothetical protein